MTQNIDPPVMNKPVPPKNHTNERESKIFRAVVRILNDLSIFPKILIPEEFSYLTDKKYCPLLYNGMGRFKYLANPSFRFAFAPFALKLKSSSYGQNRKVLLYIVCTDYDSPSIQPI